MLACRLFISAAKRVCLGLSVALVPLTPFLESPPPVTGLFGDIDHLSRTDRGELLKLHFLRATVHMLACRVLISAAKRVCLGLSVALVPLTPFIKSPPCHRPLR